jgi:hypothetical protein
VDSQESLRPRNADIKATGISPEVPKSAMRQQVPRNIDDGNSSKLEALDSLISVPTHLSLRSQSVHDSVSFTPRLRFSAEYVARLGQSALDFDKVLSL